MPNETKQFTTAEEAEEWIMTVAAYGATEAEVTEDVMEEVIEEPLSVPAATVQDVEITMKEEVEEIKEEIPSTLHALYQTADKSTRAQSDGAIATIITKPTPDFFKTVVTTSPSDLKAFGLTVGRNDLTLDDLRKLFNITEAGEILVALNLSRRGFSLVKRDEGRYTVTL